MKNNFNLKRLTDNILFLCRENDVSVSQMERDSGVKKSVIDNMKRGYIPAVDKVAAIAEYFNVTVDYLLKNDNSFNEKSLLINLPCEVGSDVYLIGRYEQRVISGKIDRFIIGDLGVPLADICTDDNDWYYACAYPADYFLTKEEALESIFPSGIEKEMYINENNPCS